MWEICFINTGGGCSVNFYSGDGSWSTNNKPREYLEEFHPEWLRDNPNRDKLGDLIVILLQVGWEPYAAAAAGATTFYYFRRQLNS